MGIVTHEGTSINEAVRLALEESDYTIGEGVDYSEIDLDRYNPTELESNPDDSLEFYKLTVYTDNGTMVGYAVRNRSMTYGRPVEVEVHLDSAD